MFDIITIGSATLDAFVETNTANIVSVSSYNDKREYMAYPYGSKLEIDNYKDAVGGGAVNSATNFSHLGLATSTIAKIGDDLQGRNVLNSLEHFGVNTSNVIVSKEEKTGFSIILLSFQGDRTVLAHRGPNATISKKDINFDAIKNSKWLYVAPLNGDSTAVLDEIAHFAEENDVNMAINIGTSSIKRGQQYLNKILKTAEVVILNKEEATMLTGIQVRPDTKEFKYSEDIIHQDVIAMLNELKSTSAKIVIITDGKHGVYAFDGRKYYQLPEFPGNVVSTLGAGDAFSSTFVAALIETRCNIETSLMYAAVNASSVVGQFGAQEGFLTFEQIKIKLSLVPEFKVSTLTLAEVSA